MKTKHLFLATALVASFASCTNDDIVEMQQGSNVERPTVDNVKLNFVTDGVDSRLTFGSNGYAWEADDVIGALNMDQPLAKTGVWSAKYGFTSFINTSYPFTYDAEAGTWGTPGKMLEGNYFFAFPFTDYEGERYAKYSLDNQQQNGIKGAVVAENYAKNQIFLGYSPILKGAEFDVLTDIEMTSLLGAVQLRIKNTGDKTYHINRIVLNGANVKSEVEINPIGAETNGHISHSYNKDNKFNPANYLGKDFEGDKVDKAVLADIENEDFAEKRMAALRDIAEYKGDAFVQLYINGEDAERAIAPGATAYALVMVNPISFFTPDEDGEYTTTGTAASTLTLDIYTDEGIIKGVNLVGEQGSTVKVAVKNVVTETVPGVANTIYVTFEDTDVKEETSQPVYTSKDLYQLINWNIKAAKKTPITATLMANDVELTKEALDLLKTNELVTLTINSNTTTDTDEEPAVYAEELVLAADLAADAIDYAKLKINSPVKVAGELALTPKSIKLSSIKVMEGAKLNINVENAIVPVEVVVAEGGELNIGAAAKVSNTVKIYNYGKATVAEGAKVSGNIYNYAKLDMDGTATYITNQGTVNMGAASKILGGANTTMASDVTEDAVINMVSGATLDKINFGGTKAGRVKYVDGAIIVHTTNTTTGAKTSNVNSTVFVEVADAEVTANTYKDKGVNLWVLTGDVNVTAGVNLTDVEIAKEADVALTVATDSTLTIGALTVKEAATLSTVGIFKTTSIDIEKNAEWTNNGTVTVETSVTNLGSVNNNGTAKYGKDEETTLSGVEFTIGGTAGTKTGTGTWLQNPYVQFDKDEDAIARVTAMTTAVTEWAKNWGTYLTQNWGASFYTGNPYDYQKFVRTMNESTEPWITQLANLKKNGYRDGELTVGLVKDSIPSEFAAVVNEYLTAAKVTAASNALFIQSTDAEGARKAGQFESKASNLLNTKVENYIFEDDAEVRNYIASVLNTEENIAAGKLNLTADNAAAIWDIAASTMATAVSTTDATKYNYIKEGDTIYTVARLWKKHSERINGETNNFYTGTANAEYNNVKRLQSFINELSNITGANKTDAHTDAITAFSTYKEFILELPENSFSGRQITACANHDADAERVEFKFEY